MTFRRRAIVVWLIAALAVVSFAWAAGDQPAAPPPSTSPTASSPSPETEPTFGVAGRRGWKAATCAIPPHHLKRTLRGYYAGRSPELTFIPREPHFFGDFKSTTTHSGPWGYVQKVPLVLYGPGFIRAQGDLALEREVTLADMAPTFAELLRTPFPDRRPGQVLRQALVPRSERNGKPRLILTVVWDGGGWNTLNGWPETWPNLRRFMSSGTSVQDATVGSNPSVTPAIHANMGTGTFPAAHGVVSIPQRSSGRIVDSWYQNDPRNLEVTTLADLYDRATNNRAKVGMLAEQGWHLGMIGRGAALAGGDRDVAVITDLVPFLSNPAYRLPGYIQDVPGFRADARAVDAADGEKDGKWLNHPLPKDRSRGRASPTWTLYQMRLLRALLREEGFGRDNVPDLFYTNFKQIDEVSHVYFLQSREMESTIPYSDRALAGLVRWMNEHVGKRKWVLAMTADHGVGPRFEDVGAWPIDMQELQIDVAIRFGARVADIFDSQRPQGFWIDREGLRRAGFTRADLANFMLGYRMRDNVADDVRVPDQYRPMLDQRLFAAAWPSEKITKMSDCRGAGA